MSAAEETMPETLLGGPFAGLELDARPSEVEIQRLTGQRIAVNKKLFPAVAVYCRRSIDNRFHFLSRIAATTISETTP